ncbi:isopenicillin N synthase family oxygenase [Rhodobacteraceae bacterium NNCM2]|nr:isopenicillin N synthase family oxygenase [Coraliihabitans acroporae]
MIPVIAIEDILNGSADEAVMAGASSSGFLTLAGVDDALGLAQLRARMLDFFAADPETRWKVVRHKYDPASRHVYRGYFPPDPAGNSLLEGYDIGPDIADPTAAGDGSDPLTEPTPISDLPGWHEAAGDYYRGLSRIGMALTRALLRGLDADEGLVERYFTRSISTLRMFRYPPHERDAIPESRHLVMPDGSTRYVMTKAHTDSGFVTLLWQDATGGLQAKSTAGDWVDVPPASGGLVVNFGQMLEDWSGGRIKATPHRVLGGLAERFSVPFFFEPAVDAVIEPLAGTKGETFVYGDFLWERMVNFPNFQGVTRRPAA